MYKFTLDVLRQYNQWYGYDLKDNQLNQLYRELTFVDGLISEEDLLYELDCMCVEQ